jgi:hypothetical protein
MKGLTLIELLVIVAICVILIAVLAPFCIKPAAGPEGHPTITVAKSWIDPNVVSGQSFNDYYISDTEGNTYDAPTAIVYGRLVVGHTYVVTVTRRAFHSMKMIRKVEREGSPSAEKGL